MNLQHAQQWAGALGSDVDALAELYSDWFTLEHGMVDDHLRDTITDREMLKAALGGIADGENGTYTFTATEWLGGTDYGLIHWDVTIEGATAFRGIPTDGKTLTGIGSTFQQFDADGKITFESTYWEDNRILAQLGVPIVRPHSAMRLGLAVGYWGLGPPAAEQLDLVREAERLGFHSAWNAEAYGSDAATVLAWLAAQTSTIRLGAAVFQIPGRSAAMTAMTAATLDRLSAGRFTLGLGTSGPQVSEGWHGRRFAHQLLRTREYVDVVRMALRREPVRYRGETLELPLADGPGKPLRLMIGPVQERVPIYLAALGPKNTALAAEIADGWLPTLVSPEHMDTFRPALEEGFARRPDRTESDFDVAPIVNVCIDDDLEAARNAMRPQLALYIGGMGPRERNFYNRLACAYGFEAAASEVQALYLAGRKEEAEAALPSELIDAVCVVGSRDRSRDRFASYRAAGVGTLIVWPMGDTARTRRDQLRLVADLAS